MLWHQLRGWQEYYSLEPFGEEAAWLRHGMLCALLANINRDPRKGKAFEPAQFMPFSYESGSRVRGGGKKVTREQAAASWGSFVGSIKKHLKPAVKENT